MATSPIGYSAIVKEDRATAKAESPVETPSTLNWVMYLSLAIGAGTINVWLQIGWSHINPHNLAWLAGDPAVYQAGWEFFRTEPDWALPLTWVGRLGYPLGVSAAYLDIIPLAAVPLRLLSSVLPADFQYLAGCGKTSFLGNVSSECSDFNEQ